MKLIIPILLCFLLSISVFFLPSCEEFAEAFEQVELAYEELEESSLLFSTVRMQNDCSSYSEGLYDIDADGYFTGVISFEDGKIIDSDEDAIQYNVESATGEIIQTPAREIIFGSNVDIPITQFTFTQNGAGIVVMTSTSAAFCDLVVTGILL